MNVKEGIAKELHKQARRNYPTRYVELKGVNDLYQSDLVDMIKFSKFNKGYKYILVVINCFSKFVIATSLKTKSASEVERTLRPIFDKYKMKHFQTDKGSEFFNHRVSNLIKKYGVNHYYTFSDKKASIVERFNRTLKNKMWAKFSAQGSYKWLDLLPKLVDTYNKTYHSTIKMKPIDVTLKNEHIVLANINSRRNKVKPEFRFKLGDKVRISRLPKVFTKGYWPRWSNEVYTVYSIKPTVPTTYLLKDERGNVLLGGFYQEEMSKTQFSDTYLVEKIIKRKGNQVLVRWLGFDKSYDSWIDKQELIK